MIQNVKDRGLRMVNRMRRILLGLNEASWYTLSHVDFRKLVSFGDGYAKHCVLNLSNPFWIDVVNSWRAFLKCNTTVQVKDVLNASICFSFFIITQRYEKGIRNIIDLFKENDTFYDFNIFKTVFDIRGTVLDFPGLLNDWRNLLIDNVQTCIETKYIVICIKRVKLLLKSRRRIYESLAQSEKDTPNRQTRELGELSKEERSKYNNALNDINEVK